MVVGGKGGDGEIDDWEVSAYKTAVEQECDERLKMRLKIEKMLLKTLTNISQMERKTTHPRKYFLECGEI